MIHLIRTLIGSLLISSIILLFKLPTIVLAYVVTICLFYGVGFIVTKLLDLEW